MSISVRPIVAIILLQCVLAGLAIPYKGHHGRGHRHSDHHHHVSHDSHKAHPRHHSSTHRTATGALRESVPSPLQDFVLVSGSPLFHERPLASVTKTNATTEVTTHTAKDQKVFPAPQGQHENTVNQTVEKGQGQVPLSGHAAEDNQHPKLEQKQPWDLSTNSTIATSGAAEGNQRPKLEQKQPGELSTNSTSATSGAAEGNQRPKLEQKQPGELSTNSTSATSGAAEGNQRPNLEQKQPGDLSINSTSATSGPILEQVHGNGTQQNVSSASNPAFKLPKEFATAGLSKEKEQHKETTNGTNNEPTTMLTLQAPKNASLGIQIFTNTKENTPVNNNVDANQAIHGKNASLGLNTFIIHGQKVNGHGDTDSSSEMTTGSKGKQTNTTIDADVKPKAQNQQQGAGHFPFNVPGMRNYGNEKTENKGAEPNKEMTDKEKLAFAENLGPNCHWKTIMGENGKLVTSVSCHGELKTPDGNIVGMDKGGKTPLPEKGETIESKQTPAGNTSAEDEKEKHEQSNKEFENEAVATTNAFRKIHRALPINLSSELSRQAKEYAEKIASMGSLQHDYDAVKQLDEGENLAMGCKQYGVPLTAKEAITNWYNEVCAYDFDIGEFSMSSGHFSQVVWSDSKEFGIGKAAGHQNGMPCTFVVGRFKPSGNYKGEYKRNVFKGTFDPSYCDKLKVKKLL